MTENLKKILSVTREQDKDSKIKQREDSTQSVPTHMTSLLSRMHAEDRKVTTKPLSRF